MLCPQAKQAAMRRFLPNSLGCYSRLPRSSSWSSAVTESEKPLLREKSSSSCHCYQLERKVVLLEKKVGQMCKAVSHLQSDQSRNGNGPSATDAPTLSRMFFESDLDELKLRVCRLESNSLEEMIRKQEEIIQKLKHNNGMLENKLDHLLKYSGVKSSTRVPLRSPSSITKASGKSTHHRVVVTRRSRSRCLRTLYVAGCLILLILFISMLIGIRL